MIDFNKLFGRVKNILLSPKTEWPVIAAETDTVAGLYKNYILILAAIPPIIHFIKFSIIGTGAFGVTYRVGFGNGLASLVVQYAISLGVVYVSALIANALAPNFGAEKNQIQALKATAYAWSASWIASIGMILGIALGWLIGLAGFVYAIYLLYLGLQHTMKSPSEKAGGYTAVTVILTIVVAFVASLVIMGPLGLSGTFNSPRAGMHLGSRGRVNVDPNSSLGKLQAWSKKMEAAGNKMEQAQKSGDKNAQSQALGAVMSAALGGGDKVEALSPDALKPFVPDTLAGMKRANVSTERNTAMGMQFSEANARYADDNGHSLRLQISDTGSAKGLTALAGWAGVEQDKETDHGYDKTYKQDGRLIHERWDSQSKSGEFSIVLGDRFAVKISGNVGSMDQLKSALGSLNLAGLEALKDQGVQKR